MKTTVFGLIFTAACLCIYNGQHPFFRPAITDSDGGAARRPLGIDNFSGDPGKAVLRALVVVLLPILAWRPALDLLAVLGIALSVALVSLAPAAPATRNATGEAAAGCGRVSHIRRLSWRVDCDNLEADAAGKPAMSRQHSVGPSPK